MCVFVCVCLPTDGLVTPLFSSVMTTTKWPVLHSAMVDTSSLWSTVSSYQHIVKLTSRGGSVVLPHTHSAILQCSAGCIPAVLVTCVQYMLSCSLLHNVTMSQGSGSMCVLWRLLTAAVTCYEQPSQSDKSLFSQSVYQLALSWCLLSLYYRRTDSSATCRWATLLLRWWIYTLHYRSASLYGLPNLTPWRAV